MWSTDNDKSLQCNSARGIQGGRAGNTADYIEKFGYDFVLPLLDFSPFLQVEARGSMPTALKTTSLSEVIRDRQRHSEKRKIKGNFGSQTKTDKQGQTMGIANLQRSWFFSL